MSSKRKSENVTKVSNKKSRQSDAENGSDLSDSEIQLPENNESNVEPDEVLIPSNEEDFEKLPEELLKTFDKDCGKLLIAGMVTWELVGKRDTGKPKQAKVRPNLCSFHRFTDEKV